MTSRCSSARARRACRSCAAGDCCGIGIVTDASRRCLCEVQEQVEVWTASFENGYSAPRCHRHGMRFGSHQRSQWATREARLVEPAMRCHCCSPFPHRRSLSRSLRVVSATRCAPPFPYAVRWTRRRQPTRRSGRLGACVSPPTWTRPRETASQQQAVGARDPVAYSWAPSCKRCRDPKHRIWVDNRGVRNNVEARDDGRCSCALRCHQRNQGKYGRPHHSRK